MRKRDIRKQVWLNEKENLCLQKYASKAGLSQENYLRALIKGYVPKELPPVEYHDMIRELHATGNNLNQIATRANATGHIDRTAFQYEANRLRKAMLDIQAAVTSPERRDDDGDNGHMESERPP